MFIKIKIIYNILEYVMLYNYFLVAVLFSKHKYKNCSNLFNKLIFNFCVKNSFSLKKYSLLKKYSDNYVL